MTKMSGADAILQSLLDRGVDTIFGLPGGQLDHFFDSMYRNSDRVRCISSRHEQGAAYMAFGYARSSDKIGVYTVVPGPGVLNTGAALCSAYATNSPVLCVTGQIPSYGIGSGRGYLHELPDQLATMKSLTKYAARIDSPEQAPEIVNEAYRNLETGRPRPVSIEMPMDIMEKQADVQLLPPEIHEKPKPDLALIEAAAKALATAKKPLILLGSGALYADEGSILALAERLQAPVASFRSGRGVVSDRHYLGATYPIGYELWREADVVIVIGSRAKMQLLYWGVDDDMTIIKIDIDPEEMNRVTTPDIAILSDVSTAVNALIPAVEKHCPIPASREDEMLALKAKIDGEIRAHLQPQMGYLDVIRQALPDDGILVDEITQMGFSSWYGYEVYKPRTLITCGYQGTLGYGFSTAIGVKFANPDKHVISINGDGGFMFTMPELSTVARYNVDMTIIVFNNNIYENVRRQQREWFDERYINSDLTNPDFVKLSESFGIPARRVNNAQGLKEAIDESMQNKGPNFIEVEVDEMATPWKFIIREQLRGAK